MTRLWGLVEKVFTKWKTWVVVGVLVISVVAWAQFGGKVKTWWLDLGGARQEIEEAREQVRASKVEIDKMTQQIQGLKREADVHKRKAAEAEGRAQKFAADADQLKQRVAALEAARKAERRVATLQEAFDALKTMGF